MAAAGVLAAGQRLVPGADQAQHGRHRRAQILLSQHLDRGQERSQRCQPARGRADRGADLLGGRSKVSVSVNELDNVAHLKAQLQAQGVVGSEWSVTAVHSMDRTLYGHSSLADQGVGPENPTLRIEGVRRLQCAQLLRGHTNEVFHLAHQTDDKMMSASADGTVRYWSTNGVSKQVIRGLLNGVDRITLLKPDGRMLATGCLDDKTVRVWDAKRSWKCAHQLKGHSATICALIGLRGGLVASGSRDRTVRVWSTETGALAHSLEGHTDAVLCMAQLASGALATGSQDCTVRLWDLESEGCIQVLEGHSEAVSCLLQVKCQDDMTHIASGSADHQIRVWTDVDGQGAVIEGGYSCIHRLQGHCGEVTCMAQLVDKRLVSGSLDYTLCVWGVDGERLQVLEGHSGAITSLTALPGGRLASGSSDYTIRIWELDEGQASKKLLVNSTWFTQNPDEEEII